YPPATELVLRGTAAVSRNLLAFKAPFLLAEGLLLGLLGWWVRRSGRKDSSLAIYAWNPLVVVEVAASGHNDPLAMLFATAALLLIIERRIVLSTLALAGPCSRNSIRFCSRRCGCGTPAGRAEDE